MSNIRFIRHGESAANAGITTSDPVTIGLTALGQAQAEAVAGSFAAAPDLIVVSPFTRARQTAAATQALFPHVPVETWPVWEFIYLSPVRYVQTNVEQRRPSVEAYWNMGDPDSVDGPGAESFAAFIVRVQQALDRLAGLDARSVAVFGHGQFMQAVRWMVTSRPEAIDTSAMQAFRAFDVARPIANGEGFVLQHDQVLGWRAD